MGCPTSTVGHNKQASNSWTNQAADIGFRAKRAWSQKCHLWPASDGSRGPRHFRFSLDSDQIADITPRRRRADCVAKLQNELTSKIRVIPGETPIWQSDAFYR